MMPAAGLDAAIAEVGASSGSLDRLRLFLFVMPRFADDMLGRRGELWQLVLVEEMGSDNRLPHAVLDYSKGLNDILGVL